MGYPAWLYINCYTFIIGVLLLFFNRKWRTHNDRRDKVFMWMLLVALFLAVSDSFGRAYQISNSEINLLLTKIGNYLVFAFDPVFYVFTMYYVESWTTENVNPGVYKLKNAIVWISVINLVLVTLSELFGLRLFYYYDAAGSYYRGQFFMIRAAVLLFCLAGGVYYCAKMGKAITHKYRKTVIMFPLICAIGSVIQSFTTELPIEYVSSIIASLILFVYLQSRDSTDDFLTGSMNRRSLDATLEAKITGATSKETTFSAIMIDVDYFKEINDTYGHAVGDIALQDVIRILHSCLRSEDQIARYGGDEFFVISPITESEYLEKAVRRIRNRVDDFNEDGEREFKLSLSLGYDIYDYESGLTAEKFIKHLDDMMYAEKEEHHRAFAARAKKKGGKR